MPLSAGDRLGPFEKVDKAVRNGDERIDWFRKDPRPTGIREDARFREILESLQFNRRERKRP